MPVPISILLYNGPGGFDVPVKGLMEAIVAGHQHQQIIAKVIKLL